jgi:PKD repeat protein
VRFSATGVDPDGGAPLRYRWTLGDGDVIGPDFEWTFTTPGRHTATVTVTDDEGMTASDEVVVDVTEPGGAAPTVQASVDKPSGPAPHTVKLSATGSDDGPVNELEYHWEFGDGGTSFDEDPHHTYLTPGSYTATVTVTDAAGKSGTAEVAVTVTDPPGNRAPSVEAAALPRSGTAPLAVLFTANGSDPDRGDELTYAWDFGDGDAGSGWRTTHTYTEGGTFTARVTVTDEAGLSASATVTVTVGNPPGNQAPTVRIAADPKSGTAPLSVRFTSSARDPEGQALMYVWEFGDGGMAGGRNATHTYRAPGAYDAKLTVTDPHGATGTATVRIVVEAAGLRTAQAALTVPSSVQAFGTRGLMVRLACDSSGSGRAAVKVTRSAARRLGLASRTLAARAVRCAAGRVASVRLKPSRSTARRLARSRMRTLRLELGISVDGRGALRRKVTIR